jgi:glycosyltransferase involved in cell wall biosynthesis
MIANQLSWIGGQFVFVGQQPTPNETKSNLAHDWVSCPVPIKRYRRPIILWEILWAVLISITALRAARRYQCGAMLLIQYDDSYMAAGWLIAKLGRLPIVLYVADLWAEPPREEVPPVRRTLSRMLQRRLIHLAFRVVSSNSGLARVCQDAYGVSVEVVPNCFTREVVPLPPTSEVATSLTVGFCGNIYWHNLGPLRVLSLALHDFPNSKLIVFGSKSGEELRAMGVNPPWMESRFVPGGVELLGALSECDLLFLPGAFDAVGRRALVIETMMPTKVLDYLGAGRPILLNCPGRSDLAKLLSMRNAALVVDDPDVEPLRSAIRELVGSAALRAELAEGAHELAKEHQGPESSRRLWRVLQAASRRNYPLGR